MRRSAKMPSNGYRNVRLPRLECEACHYEEAVEAITKDLIGHTCPVCQEVTFTKGHWRSYQRVRLYTLISKVLFWLWPWSKPTTYTISVTEKSVTIREQ